MKCVFAGTPAAAVPALTSLLESSHEVVGVLTQPPARRGRGRRVVASPVEEVAREAGVDVFTPRHLRDDEAIARIRSWNADVAPVVAYGQIIPKAALDVCTHGWINLHFSLLPRWRGASPVQHAIMAGDAMTGVSVFQIEEGLDTGPVYAQHPYPILPEATTPTLMDALARHGADVLVHVLDALEHGTAQARAQASEGITYAGLIRSADAEIDFSRPGEDIERLVRACADNPGTWAMLGETRLKIDRVVCQPSADLEPGCVHVTKNAVSVGTGTCDLLIARLAAPGKKVMPAADWARGARLGAQPRFTYTGGN
ncbi:methionyl-tRNA formyltransferase [Nanchangia anserum]|uniref:Methionyl-tRNA formyltransferase n=1 Tax=Nanchangia anserum TaxID=2692125 RepID=A0A8I0KQU4_9ACTO|nr:methionyl-tRNA formyltransferase [Nanchangia anserum]MBD3688792.1 methionyl-tRNA formyltransferase [Nanchangia anserum]QOX82526.1 methionyl-tRNA formyltransferase [Nanchangia anserum]